MEEDKIEFCKRCGEIDNASRADGVNMKTRSDKLWAPDNENLPRILKLNWVGLMERQEGKTYGMENWLLKESGKRGRQSV